MADVGEALAGVEHAAADEGRLVPGGEGHGVSPGRGGLRVDA